MSTRVIDALTSLVAKAQALVSQLTTPPEDGSDILTLAPKLKEDLQKLLKEESDLYGCEKQLLDYLMRNRRRKDNDLMPKKEREDPVWQSLPKGIAAPSAVASWKHVNDIISDLKDDLKEYETTNVALELRNANTALAQLSDEINWIIDGHIKENYEHFKVIHDGWLAGALPSSQPQEPPSSSVKRWGDESSEDDDTVMLEAVSSILKKGESKEAGIDLPGDFETCFPWLNKRIKSFCARHSWETRYIKETNLRSQGLISYVISEDNKQVTVPATGNAVVDHNNKLALASLYASVAALSIKPESLLAENSTEVAITFFCSILAREKLATSENKDYLRIALKNGDGGRATYASRMYTLCKTGSSAIKLIIDSIEKLYSKFARELSDDKLDDETVQCIITRAFTTTEGMLQNSFRSTRKEEEQVMVTVDAKKRETKTFKKVWKTSKVVPDLSIAGAPLRADEVTMLLSIKEQFNNRTAEVEKRLLEKTSQATLFDKPKICLEVVQEAYQRLQSYKTILKERVMLIRARATALNDGKKPSPTNWATAKSEVLTNTSSMPQSIIDELIWRKETPPPVAASQTDTNK